MVTVPRDDHLSGAWLSIKMVLYATSFLAFILAAVPYLFDQLGKAVLPPSVQLSHSPGVILHIVGGIIGIGGLLGYLISALWLVIVGKGPFVEFDPPKEFVATGPYRWTRNPVAICLIITILGEAIYFASTGIFILFLLGFPLAQLQVTKIEEPRLRKRFGESYDAYCRRVSRWVPRIPRNDPTTPSS